MPPVKATAKKAAPQPAAPAKKATATKAAAPKPKQSHLPDEITELEDGLSQFASILIFGDPGSGKTPLAATAPNAIILECDRGLQSAVLAKSKAKKWTLSDYNDATKAYEYMRNKGCDVFDWLILDSITMFQERGLTHIMEDLHAEKPHRQVWAADKGEYQQNMLRTSRFIRDLVDLPINVIIVATAMVSQTPLADGESIEEMWPSIQGIRMPQKISSYVGIVAHLQRVVSKKDPTKIFPVLSTERRDGWYAKDRYAVIGRMPNPTMPKVIAAIEAKKNGSDTKTKGE